MISVCFIGDRSIYLKRICNYLAGKDFIVYLICRHDNGIKINEFDKRITIHTLKSNRLMRKMLEINSFLKKSHPDFVHYQYLAKDILLTLFICRKFHVIATPWGSDLNIFSKNIINRFIINIGLLTCKKIQIISEGIRKEFERRFKFINKKKLVEISWGIDYDKFHTVDDSKLQYWRNRLNIRESDIVILSYRNHKKLYNHHTLIKSLPIVLDNFQHVKCFFTRGSYDESYLENNKKLVSKLNIQNHVEFIEEWIPDALLPALIHSAHIVVSIPFYDGLPSTLLEIMATKAIPVIGGLSVYSSFFRDNENGRILKEIEDYDQLAHLIIDIIENFHEYSERYSRINNNYVLKEQNWDLQKIKMQALYTL